MPDAADKLRRRPSRDRSPTRYWVGTGGPIASARQHILDFTRGDFLEDDPYIVLAEDDQIARALEKAAADADLGAKLNFLRSEWAHVVDAWQVTDAAEYLAVPRLGRDLGMTPSSKCKSELMSGTQLCRLPGHTMARSKKAVGVDRPAALNSIGSTSHSDPVFRGQHQCGNPEADGDAEVETADDI